MDLYAVLPDLSDERCREQFLALAESLRADPLFADEDWRYAATPDFTSRDYLVSSMGRVLSLPRYRDYDAGASSRIRHRKFQPGSLMRPGTQPSGHRTINLIHEKRYFRTHVHRLVAWTFLGPRPAGRIVRHRDGDPANNRLANLYYGKAASDAAASANGDVLLAIGPALAARIEAAARGTTDPEPVLNLLLEQIASARRRVFSNPPENHDG